MIARLALFAALAPFALSACAPSREYRETREELQRYAMVQTKGEISFLPGDLSAADFAGDAPEQYARLQKESVTCRADIVVNANGSVREICTICTNTDQYAWRVSDSFVRRLRFKPGSEGRHGALIIAYAPTRPDASLILPHVAAPEAGCAPKPVNA